MKPRIEIQTWWRNQCNIRNLQIKPQKSNSNHKKIETFEKCILGHHPRPWSCHFHPLTKFPGAIRCTKPFFNVLTRNWRSLIEIHRADPALWPQTCHHVADFLFDQNFASTPRRGKDCLFDSSTQNKESSLQAILKNRCFMKKRRCTITPSPAIHLAGRAVKGATLNEQ